MKKKISNFVIPFNLQFFAEGDGAGGDKGQDNSGAGSENDNQGSDNGGKGGERSFTQSEVNALMAREKKEGKSSVLKSLGFTSEKEAQDAVKLLKALTDSQKTDAEKSEEAKKEVETKIAEAEARAQAAEDKLTMVKAGVSPDAVDDVLAIASLRVSDSKDLSKVLEEMKKEQRYSGFFAKEENNDSAGGTGNPIGSGGSGSAGGGSENYGATLAKTSPHLAGEKKSSFFN